jgi:type IV secretory pathway TrbD component
MKSRTGIVGLGIPTWVLSIFEWMIAKAACCLAARGQPLL